VDEPYGFKHFGSFLIMDIFGFSLPLLQLDISQKTRRFTCHIVWCWSVNPEGLLARLLFSEPPYL
jgi:uncharacterized membrane protein YagU involved in acid resistance